MQQLEKWYPIPVVPEFLHSAFVLQAGYSDLFIVCDGEFGNDECVVLSFGVVESFIVHEEFAHRWLGSDELAEPPRSDHCEYTFPFLKVKNSIWAENSQVVNRGEIAEHYCIVSLGYIIDILSTHTPKVIRVPASSINSVIDMIANFQ